MTKSDKHLENFSASKMRPGEKMLESLKGYMSGKEKDSKDALMTGRLILTDQRVCFYRKGFIGEKFESIDLGKVSSIETNSLLGHRSVKLYSTHNELAFNSFKSKEEFDPVIAKIEDWVASAGTKPAEATQDKQSPTDQLRKLAELRDSGILTAAEFELKKTDLLARI